MENYKPLHNNQRVLLYSIRKATARNNVPWELGFIGFGDVLIGEPITKTGFTNSADIFKESVATHPMLSGGDEPESQIDALFEAMEMNFSQSSQIILILITDASPHDPDAKGRTSKEFIKLARSRNAIVNIVGPNLSVYRDMVDSTGGILIDISHNNDMKQILDTLSQTVVNIATQVSSSGKLTKWWRRRLDL